MGLDVNLVQFKDVDTDAIMEFARFAYEPDRPGNSPRMTDEEKGRALGLPESAINTLYFGGTPISFPSKKHPKSMPVGEWYAFSGARELMHHFAGLPIYIVFPEAIGDPPCIRPNWAAARNALAVALEELQKVSPEQIEDYHARFVLPEIHPFMQKKIESVPASMRATPSQIFAGELAQIEVMIETLDYVLNHQSPREFLLRWSA